MSFLPVGNSRVPFMLNQKLGIDNILSRQRDLTRIAQELATGVRISAPRVDPSGAAQVSLLQGLQEQMTQYMSNLRVSNDSHATIEQAFRTAEDGISAALSIALRNNTNTISETERAGDIQALDGIIDNLLNAGNITYLGRPVFGGQQVNGQPFVRDGVHIQFQGDQGLINTFGDANTLFPINITANASFGTDTRAGMGADLDVAVTPSTRLSELNRGTGISKGSILIDDGSGTGFVAVDLSQADTVRNVLDKLNDPALGLAITASINPASNGIQITSTAGPITIREVAGNTTAADLGIAAEAQASPLVGVDLNPTISLTTPISSLRGGAGLDLSGGLAIENGNYSAVVDFTNPPTNTVEDLLNRINGAGVRVRAEINSARNGINIVGTLSGAAFSIRETSETSTTGQQLGVLTTNLDTPLAEFQNGAGIDAGPGDDLRITTRDGNVYDVDVSSAKTVRDLQDLIAAATGGNVTLDVHPQGGLRLTESAAVVPNGMDGFRVESLNGSPAAENLGILTDAGTAANQINGDPNAHRSRVNGLFDSLVRLREGLATGNLSEIELAAKQLDSDRQRLLSAAGRVGGYLSTFETVQNRLDDQMVALKEETAQLYEPDFSETVTRLALGQTALQAALASTSRLLQGSLLDFL